MEELLKKLEALMDLPSISKNFQLEPEEDYFTVVYWHKRKPFMLARIGTAEKIDTEVRAYQFVAEVSTVSPVHIEVDDDGFHYKVAARVDYAKATDKELEEGVAKIRAALTESIQLIEKVETATDEYLEKLRKIAFGG
jgi:hypothetical protein